MVGLNIFFEARADLLGRLGRICNPPAPSISIFNAKPAPSISISQLGRFLSDFGD